jgi:hypothetical protein
MTRIKRAAVVSAAVATLLTGCTSANDRATEQPLPSPSPSGGTPADASTDSTPTPDEFGGDDDVFKVDPSDVRIEKCGQVDPDIGAGGSDAVYVTVKNSASVRRHFLVTVDTYGPDGIRGEEMYPKVWNLAPGETARARGNTGDPEVLGLTCRLGPVRAIPSEGVPIGTLWWLDNAS